METAIKEIEKNKTKVNINKKDDQERKNNGKWQRKLLQNNKNIENDS